MSVAALPKHLGLVAAAAWPAPVRQRRNANVAARAITMKRLVYVWVISIPFARLGRVSVGANRESIVTPRPPRTAGCEAIVPRCWIRHPWCDHFGLRFGLRP